MSSMLSGKPIQQRMHDLTRRDDTDTHGINRFWLKEILPSMYDIVMGKISVPI
jgi:hypothetical protein